MNSSMHSIYGVKKPEDHGVPKSLFSNSNRGVIYQQRGIGRQISSWLLEPVKLQGSNSKDSSYAVDLKKTFPKLGLAHQEKQNAKRSANVHKEKSGAGGTVLPSISGKLNPYRTSDIKYLKSQYNGKSQRDNWQANSQPSPGKKKKTKRVRSPSNKTKRLQSKVEIYSMNTNPLKSRSKAAKVLTQKSTSGKYKSQGLPKTFHTSKIDSRAKLLSVFLRQPGQNVNLLEDNLHFVSSEKKHDILMKYTQVLIRHQYYFSSIRIVHSQQSSLESVLQDLMQRITGSMQNESGTQSWKWNLVDHELFLKQFGDLKIVQQYTGVRRKLLGMGENGVIALARVEKEILLKVVSDFMEQLSLPSYQKTTVSELVREETGTGPLGDDGDKPETADSAQYEDVTFAQEKSAAADSAGSPEATASPEEDQPTAEEEENAPPAPPAPGPSPPEDDAPAGEDKSWQEIEKERLEAEMQAVKDAMEESADPATAAAESEEAESQQEDAETNAEETQPVVDPEESSEAKLPAQDPETETEVETQSDAKTEAKPETEAAESTPDPVKPVSAEEELNDSAEKPALAEEEAPREEEKDTGAELSERELLEKEREAMELELKNIEDGGTDAQASPESAEGEGPAPAESKKEAIEAQESAKEQEEQAKAKALAEEEEMQKKQKEQMEKEMQEAKEKAEAAEKAKREEEEAREKARLEEEARAAEKAKREEEEALERAKEEEEARALEQAKKEAEALALEKARKEEEEAKEKAEKEKAEKEKAEKEAKEKEAKEKEEQAAIKIQSRARGMLAKKKVDKVKTQVKEEKAAIKIQSRARGMLAKKKVNEVKAEKAKALEKEKASEPAPAPVPAPVPAPAEPKAEKAAPEPVDEMDDIEKLRQQALEEQKRLAKEEGVDLETVISKPAEEEKPDEPELPSTSAASFEEPSTAPVVAKPKEEKIIEPSFEDVVAREEEKQEKAEQDIEDAIKRMREEMRLEKERLRKEMEEKRRKLQEARQRKRESAAWKKTPITIINNESPLKLESKVEKDVQDQAVKLLSEDIDNAKKVTEELLKKEIPIDTGSSSIVGGPEAPLALDKLKDPALEPKPKAPEMPAAPQQGASFEKEIHQALKHVQEQLALQQQQFLQMQFTNMNMQTPGMITPGGPNFARGNMNAPMMTPLNEATPSIAQLGQPSSNNAPTPEEITEYAVYLGMDPVADKELLYIAEWALSAPLPEGWTEHVDTSGNEFYFNSMTGVSTYEHPLDGQFREYYRQMKMQAQSK